MTRETNPSLDPEKIRELVIRVHRLLARLESGRELPESELGQLREMLAELKAPSSKD